MGINNEFAVPWGVEEAVLSLYECTDCEMQWCAIWDSGCDDDCPECGISFTPYQVIHVQDLNVR